MRGVRGVSKGGAAAGGRGVARAAAQGFAAQGFAAQGFTVGAAGTAPGAAVGPAAPASVAAAGMSLLAAQESGARSERDAAAGRRARSMLRELQGLQIELLDGHSDPARLQRLAALGAGEEGVDPGLREAVRAVALRARIELARRAGMGVAERSASVP